VLLTRKRYAKRCLYEDVVENKGVFALDKAAISCYDRSRSREVSITMNGLNYNHFYHEETEDDIRRVETSPLSQVLVNYNNSKNNEVNEVVGIENGDI
jgi:hypothetical protein